MYCIVCNRLFQYLATIAGTFSIISVGINLGWTSPYLPVLLNSTISPVPITSAQGSWCAVIPLIGAVFGAFIGALLVDRIGRKFTILMISPVVLTSFICIAYANTFLLILLPRFAIGISEGLLYTALPIYLGEIADPEIRGFLGSTIAVAYVFGVLVINLVGPLFSIFTSSMICAILPIAHIAMFMWMPESPYYLIKKMKYSDAEASLQVLRGKCDVQEEMFSLRLAVERQESKKNLKISDLVTVRSNRRAVFIFVILCLSNNFSGKNAFIFYTTMIFQTANGMLSPTLSVILYTLVGLIATILGLCLVDKFGRRQLMMFSVSGCAISLALEGLYFFLQIYAAHTTKYLNWLPIAGLLSFNFTFGIGIFFGPVLLLGELFPTNIKGKALALADILASLSATAASQYFYIMNETVGMYVPFWTFSLACTIGAIFIYYFLIETNGKTLEEIQLELIGKK